jgi:hypothetical protein
MAQPVVGCLAGIIGTQFIEAQSLPRFVVFFGATILHAVISIGLYELLNLADFGTPYAAVAGQATANAIIGVVAFNLAELLPGAVDRRRAAGRTAFAGRTRMALHEERRRVGSRLGILQAGVIVLFSALAVSFWILQVVQHARFEELAENNHQRTLALRAPRGMVFDRDGTALVQNRASFNISIVREHTKNLDHTIPCGVRSQASRSALCGGSSSATGATGGRRLSSCRMRRARGGGGQSPPPG